MCIWELMKYGMLVEYISVPRKKLFSQKKNWELTKLSVQYLKGLPEKFIASCWRKNKTMLLLADLHLTHFATYLLLGYCQGITPCCLICLIISHKSIYLSFASSYISSYWFMSYHFGKVAQNRPCFKFIPVTGDYYIRAAGIKTAKQQSVLS